MAKMKTLLYDVQDLYDKGYNVRDIADMMGLQIESVVYLLKENGVIEPM